VIPDLLFDFDLNLFVCFLLLVLPVIPILVISTLPVLTFLLWEQNNSLQEVRVVENLNMRDTHPKNVVKESKIIASSLVLKAAPGSLQAEKGQREKRRREQLSIWMHWEILERVSKQGIEKREQVLYRRKMTADTGKRLKIKTVHSHRDSIL